MRFVGKIVLGTLIAVAVLAVVAVALFTAAYLAT